MISFFAPLVSLQQLLSALGRIGKRYDLRPSEPPKPSVPSGA